MKQDKKDQEAVSRRQRDLQEEYKSKPSDELLGILARKAVANPDLVKDNRLSENDTASAVAHTVRGPYQVGVSQSATLSSGRDRHNSEKKKLGARRRTWFREKAQRRWEAVVGDQSHWTVKEMAQTLMREWSEEGQTTFAISTAEMYIKGLRSDAAKKRSHPHGR